MSRRGGFPGGMGGFGGMNINQLMKEAKKMQADMERSQEELVSRDFDATAGGGAISVKVSGDKQIKEIKLQKAIIPDGYWIELKSSDGKSIHAPFYWKNKKILLFTELQREDYDFMNLNQNKYTCFMLNENLDTAEFVKLLRSE